jgi:hypothetical protein
MTEKLEDHAEDRITFRNTLVRVMAMQLVSLIALWLLQQTYTF